jgi:ABC-type polysaccharide/polyol phosphate export permease
MAAYFGAVWDCRYFWLSLVYNDLRARYRGSVLGLGWSLLQPLMMTAILCVVFSTIFQQDYRRYAPFLLAGLAFWNYVLGVSVNGCQCFFQGEAYIKQFPAPLAIYPLRTSLGLSFHFAVALALVLAINSWFQGPPSPAVLLSLAPTVLLLLVLGWALAVLFGLANVFFRDTKHLSEVAFQALFYLTPVMYTPDMLAGRRLGSWMEFNPLTPFLKLLRAPLVDNALPDPAAFAAATLLTAAAAAAALLALRCHERRLIFAL